MLSKHLIYALLDPRNGEIRYVGKSSSGLQRAQSHGGPKRLAADDTHKGRWIRVLAEQGLRYQIRVLEETTAEDLARAEVDWIARGHALGWNLTNATDGGDGGLPGLQHTAETREKVRQSKLGKKRAPFTPEARANMAAAQKRRYAEQGVSEAAIEKNRASNTGKKRSAETCERIRASRSGTTLTEEHKARIGESGRGKKRTPEQCENIAAAKREWWAARKAQDPLH
jgi:hypothetical protein